MTDVDRARESGDDPPVIREPRPGEPDGLGGGADAVEKTTYTAHVHGAEVEEREPPPVPVTATVTSGGGLGPLGWGALLLALLAFAAYAVALFR